MRRFCRRVSVERDQYKQKLNHLNVEKLRSVALNTYGNINYNSSCLSSFLTTTTHFSATLNYLMAFLLTLLDYNFTLVAH